MTLQGTAQKRREDRVRSPQVLPGQNEQEHRYRRFRGRIWRKMSHARD